MKNFSTELVKLRDEAIASITNVLKKRGTNYQLIDPSEYEDEVSDEIYDLPRAFKIGRFGSYDEFPIVVVNIENDVITFEGINCMSEGSDDKIFIFDELSSAVICEIADFINHLEN